jgi:hypothetical protein
MREQRRKSRIATPSHDGLECKLEQANKQLLFTLQKAILLISTQRSVSPALSELPLWIV